MNVPVETPELARTLSPIVTPLPFYRRPLACRQIAVVVLAVLAMIGGALRWQALTWSVHAAVVQPPREPRRALSRIELVVVDLRAVADEAPSLDPEPCL